MIPLQSHPCREALSLDGIWDFCFDWKNEGLKRGWARRPLPETRPMPVPASYDELVQDAAERDHQGLVWYERRFVVPPAWRDRRIVLRFGSVNQHATVFVNGVERVHHRGGFMPFEIDLTGEVRFDRENRLTVAVDNRLDESSLPPGRTLEIGGEFGVPVDRCIFLMDFYNYAGIHRPVTLYATPRRHIHTVRLTPGLNGKTGRLDYVVECSEEPDELDVRLRDAAGREVKQGRGAQGTFRVREVDPWTPARPNLYRLQVAARWGDDWDRVRLQTGFRSIAVRGNGIYLNGKRIYLRGWSMHEDSDLHGRGYDAVRAVKDVQNAKWAGANCIRTAHYPHSEEFLDLCDRVGLLVIDEAQIVGFSDFDIAAPPDRRPAVAVKPELLDFTKDAVKRLIARDRHHPCVIAWNIGNECGTDSEAGEAFFREVIAHVRELDPSRLVTNVGNVLDPAADRVAPWVDVCLLNRYYGWYIFQGSPALGAQALEVNLREWHKRHKKPIVVSEFGADTVQGLHAEPSTPFSEEYQRDLLESYVKVFDRLSFITGELVWVYADFATPASVQRVGGNRKGLFTRQRQPKLAAHVMRARWRGLGV